MRHVRVAVPPAPYSVVIGRGALQDPRLERTLRGATGALVTSSREVMRLHGSALMKALGRSGLVRPRVVLLKEGEEAKTVSAWESVVRALAGSRIDRSGVVIAFGGGSIGDAAGFAAATYMRGIRFIQIPTTLLAMVDSSVGGKTGINLEEGKNLVGSFHQPALVLSDLSVLRTLPARERQSGVYEILKCALLRSTKLLQLVEATRGLRSASEAELEQAITEAVRIKARIVERDERESGERVFLNLGHTLGHALEAATSYEVFTHGEAVGYGMEFAVDLGEALEMTPKGSAELMRRAIRSVGARPRIAPAIAARAGRASRLDKKRQGRAVREILLESPQRPIPYSLTTEAFARIAERWLNVRAKPS